MSVAAVIEREYRTLLPAALKRDPRTTKVIARSTSKTPRAVENWREGLNLPRVPQFIALARDNPELREKILEWLNAGPSGDDPSGLARDITQFLIERGRR